MSTIVMTQPMENPGPTRLAIEPVQRTAAKTVGFLYLFAMAISIFGESVRGRLILPHDAVQTASSIAASEALFRLSIVGDLIIYVCDIVLFWGLYVILKRVNKDVALLAVLFRLVETAILGVTTLTAFIALRLLSGADYLRAVDTAQLQALARGFLSVRLGRFQLFVAEVAVHSPRTCRFRNLCVASHGNHEPGYHGVPRRMGPRGNGVYDADGSLRSRSWLLVAD
jgi:hypothetical protein